MINNKEIMIETYYYNREKVIRYLQLSCVLLIIWIAFFNTTNLTHYVGRVVWIIVWILIINYLSSKISTTEILNTKEFKDCSWLNRHKIMKINYQENTKIFLLTGIVIIIIFANLVDLGLMTKDPYRIISLLFFTMLVILFVLDVGFHLIYKFEFLDTHDEKELNPS